MIVHLKTFQGKHLFTNKAFKRCLLFLYICTIFVPNGHIKQKHRTYTNPKKLTESMAFHLDLLSCCNTVTEAANEMLPTFPFVEIKSCFLKPSTALQSFPESSTAAGGRGTWECFFLLGQFKSPGLGVKRTQ